MAYWLIKANAGDYSWNDLCREPNQRTDWSWVRSRQALKFMQAMRNGDKVLFYHSTPEQRIIGVAEVVKEYYTKVGSSVPGVVDIRAVRAFQAPVTLARMRDDHHLVNLPIYGRLSVAPVDKYSWNLICTMGGIGPI